MCAVSRAQHACRYATESNGSGKRKFLPVISCRIEARGKFDRQNPLRLDTDHAVVHNVANYCRGADQ